MEITTARYINVNGSLLDLSQPRVMGILNVTDDDAEQGHEEAEQHVTGIPYTVKICSGHVLEQKYGQGDFIIE